MSLWKRVYQERRRVLLPLTVVIVLNVLLLLLVVLPLGRGVQATNEASVNAGVALANAKRLEQDARRAAGSKERAEQELQRFYGEVLPRDFATASRTANRWLQQAARDAGLEYTGARFDWEEIRESRLSRAFSTVTLTGRYADIRRFLYAVETAEEFIVVERVELAQSETAQQAGAAGAIEVSLVVSTYFVTPAQP